MQTSILLDFPLCSVQQSSEWSRSQWKDEAGRLSVIQEEAPVGNWKRGPAPQTEVGVGDRNLGVVHTEMNIPPRQVDVLPRNSI